MNEPGVKDAFSGRLLEYRSVEKRKLVLSLSITSVVMVVELVGGLLTNSIALISDAGHMLTHCVAIGLGLVAIIIARKPPCHHRTFGLYRSEILAGFVNGLFLVVVAGVIVYEAISRIMHPKEILGLQMLAIALVGLAVNCASIFILRGSHRKDLNVRSVFYHMIGDAASSVGVVIAAIFIFRTEWSVIDPLISLGVSALIVFWAWGLLKESAKVLLEMAPKGLNVDMISEDLKRKFPEIEGLYNTHLWTITTDMLVFSAHIRVRESTESNTGMGNLCSRINEHLLEKYGVIESTIQIAADQETDVCNIP